MGRALMPILIAHVVALAVWLGAVGGSALSAAIIFPTMRTLDPRLPAYAAYEGEHWVLGAGRIAERIFRVADAAQVGAAAAAILTALALVAMVRGSARSIFGAVWLLGLAGGSGVLGARLLWLGPRMDAALHRAWDAALAGDTPAAEAARGVFGSLHPAASNLMAATLVLVLIALVAVLPAMRARPSASGPVNGGQPGREAEAR